MTKAIINKVKRFIKDNDLKFEGVGSELNSNCAILAGFMCYILTENDMEYVDEGYKITSALDLSANASKELKNVFYYAFYNNYKEFWTTDDASKQYVF